MILSIGEILADMIGEVVDEKISFNMFCGGAPFNVAVNAKQSGGKVGFIGRVGNDLIGKNLIKFSQTMGLDELNIQVDPVRNTTLAFVSLCNGERDFTFFRHKTADYNIDINSLDFDKYNIIHLGSLMLSEPEGIDFANKVIEKVKCENKILSFDVNFRMDLYKSLDDAIKAYKPFVETADILKFSDDEILAFTGKSSLDEAICSLKKQNRLLLITLGSKGSMYVYNEYTNVIPTVPVKPIDTTGAGDAFFGCLLSNLDGKEFTKENIENALMKANKKGAETTQFMGAIK